MKFRKIETKRNVNLSWLAVKISVPSPVEYSPATHGTVAPSTLTVVFPQLPSIYHTHNNNNNNHSRETGTSAPGEKKNNRAPSPCLHGPKHSKRHCRHTCVGKTSPFPLRIRISGVASLVADRRALHHARYGGSCGCGFWCTSIEQPTHTT